MSGEGKAAADATICSRRSWEPNQKVWESAGHRRTAAQPRLLLDGGLKTTVGFEEALNTSALDRNPQRHTNLFPPLPFYDV